MPFTLCIFDLDGTLVDTGGDITNAVNDVLEYYRIERMERKTVVGYVGDGIRKLVERCTVGHPIDIDEAVSLFKEAYTRRLVETTRPYPGVVETLDRLAGRVKTVLTNKSYPFTRKILARLNLEKYFSMVIGGDTFERKKPHTDAVDHILRNTGAQKADAVMIGDGKNDVLTARNAGICSVFVTYGFGSLDGLGELKPDFVIHSPEELMKIC
jgi:phosphoglycolate phosphatase